MKAWMMSEDRLVRSMWPRYPARIIAEKLGRSDKSVTAYGIRCGLEKAPAIERKQPPKSEWIATATRFALDAGLDPDLLLAGDKSAEYARVRHRAWKQILASNRHYSAAGLGRVAGYNHTSILYGLRRLKAAGYG